MDKQLVEEMAKVIEEAMAKARRTIGGHNNIAMFYANMLYNAGYRKIPEGAELLEYKSANDGKTYVFPKFEKIYPISEKGQSDWLDGYKVGYRDGVIAVKTQTKEKLDEICKELTGGK